MILILRQLLTSTTLLSSKRTIVAMSTTNNVALPIPNNMKVVHVDVPLIPTALSEMRSLGVSRAFVLSNRSSRPLIEGEGRLMEILKKNGLLVGELNCDVGMGGGEDGLLKACDAAYEANADCVVTIGGGAIQDAGKLIRLWLSTRGEDGSDSTKKATVAGIQAGTKREPMPALPPQIACPNSFAMAELTHVAGITTNDKTKNGAAHPSLMPTVVIYDSALSKGLPNWVRFGTALRGVEHAVGAVTHPKADEDIRTRALAGLELINSGLKAMVEDPESTQAQSDCYRGGWMAIRALNTGCYPALGHLIENHYAARFDVHQGSCSGILCARFLHYYRQESAENEKRISKALGDEHAAAAVLVRDLVATLPGVAKEHSDVGVTAEMLQEFAKFEYDGHLKRLNQLSPKAFKSEKDILHMLSLQF